MSIDVISGYPTLAEVLSASTTAAYSKKVFYPNTILRLLPTADMDVKFCREFLPAPEMGRATLLGTGPEVLTDVWASDAEGAELSNKLWRTGEMVTTGNVTLDKTQGNLAYSHVMEISLADQDDVIRLRIGGGRRFGDYDYTQALPLEALTFSINHKESNAANLLQVQIRKGPAVDDKYWTFGAGWGAGPVWNDITGSAIEVWLQLGTCTPDDLTKPYTLALRSKSDAAETSHVSHIGLHQTIAFGSATRLAQDVEYFFQVPYRCRIGADMEAGTGKLYISDMGL